jgi:hypothetical protein
MGDVNRLGVAEYKYGNQTALTPTFKVKNYICSKIYIWYDKTW